MVAGSLAVAFALSIRVRRRISAPILDLAGTARSISARKDYALRARKTSDDEIGQLTDSFNEMLATIQARDSELRTTQREIESLNVELEQRVRDRTEELETANKDLAAWYSVSHDLRAPLRAIDGFEPALAEEAADRLDANGRRHLERDRAAAQELASFIDDLLSLAQISRKNLQRENVDLSEVAAEVFSALAREEPLRKVTFEIARQVTAQADEGLLRIALQNLIGNAWKFTSKREGARIEFGVQSENGQPEYFVRDNGAGFDMAYAGKLFGAFQRLHAATDFPARGSAWRRSLASSTAMEEPPRRRPRRRGRDVLVHSLIDERRTRWRKRSFFSWKTTRTTRIDAARPGRNNIETRSWS